MPSASDILDGRTRIARSWTTLAIVWHVVRLIGTFRLHVMIDLVLLGGAIALGIAAFLPRLMWSPSDQRR